MTNLLIRWQDLCAAKSVSAETLSDIGYVPRMFWNGMMLAGGLVFLWIYVTSKVKYFDLISEIVWTFLVCVGLYVDGFAAHLCDPFSVIITLSGLLSALDLLCRFLCIGINGKAE
jgi:hypothetical protein